MSSDNDRGRKRSKCSLNSRLYKVIVIGEVNTGKSAIIRRYVHNFYTEHYRSTVGVDFNLKILPYNEELEIRLQLWDIAGQERFSKMTRAYFRGAMGAIVVFDLSNYNSFDSIKRWKRELDVKCALPGGKRLPAILVANKSDLRKHPRMPEDLEISKFAQSYGFVPKWFKTSAKTGHYVEEAMNLMVKYIMAMDTWSSPIKSPSEKYNCVKTFNRLPPMRQLKPRNFDFDTDEDDDDDDEEDDYVTTDGNEFGPSVRMPPHLQAKKKGNCAC